MFSDALYAAAGAEIVSAEEAWKQQLVAKVRVPTLEEAAKIGDRAIMSVVQVNAVLCFLVFVCLIICVCLFVFVCFSDDELASGLRIDCFPVAHLFISMFHFLP